MNANLVVAVAVVAMLAWLLLQWQSTQRHERCTDEACICAAGGTPHGTSPSQGYTRFRHLPARLLTWSSYYVAGSVTWPLGSGASTAPWRRLGHARTSRCSTICCKQGSHPITMRTEKRQSLHTCRWWALHAGSLYEVVMV